MNDINFANVISKTIFNRFGLEFLVDQRRGDGGPKLIMRLKDYPEDEGFIIQIQIGWKRLFFEFNPENKAGLLLAAMGNSALSSKEISRDIASSIIEKHGDIFLEINHNLFEPQSPWAWPAAWKKMNVTVKSPIFDIDGDLENHTDIEVLLIDWLSIFLSFLIPLLPLAQIDTLEENSMEGLPEGSLTTITINRYERSKVNRQICISYFGASCLICGFDFGKKYGAIGKGVIEVHHITPVSTLGADYKVNPITDLMPICSNCHTIIHKQNPPITPDDMRKIISKYKEEIV